jgi:hypothetical protein
MTHRVPLGLRSILLGLLLVLAGIDGSDAAWAQSVVPGQFANAEAPGANAAPFAAIVCGAGGIRYQQIYAGSQVGSGTIAALRFRRDGPQGQAFGPITFHGVTVRLSSTAVAPNDLTIHFDANTGADVKTVFQGDLTLQAGASSAVPRPFEVSIPLSPTFHFDAAAGDSLLMEIRITGCATATALDYAPASPSVSRTLAADAQAGNGTALNLGGGLVTQFTMAGAPCRADPTTLCIDNQLGDRRFRIRVTYQTSQGGGLAGTGRAIPLAALRERRGGLFWFFDAKNPEVLFKILDGCAANNHFWIFFSAGTNVGFTVTVTDTLNGHTWTRTNADLHAAAPVQDTAALACN